MEEQKPAEQQPEKVVTQVKPPKKQNPLELKIIYGLAIFMGLLLFFMLLELLPFCKEKCNDELTSMEVLCVPLLLVLSALTAETIVDKANKIEEKPIEEPSKEISFQTLLKTLMGASLISLVLCGIPNLIFLGILGGNCESHDYASCGSAGLIAAYYYFFFPLIAAGTVYGSYKLSYLVFVPLRSIGTFPNGKEIMKHVAPMWARIVTMGISAITVILILVMTLISINS